MDDAAKGNDITRSTHRSGRAKDPKKKYMELLQRVADRQTSEVCIELDDLNVVSFLNFQTHAMDSPSSSMRKASMRTRG